MAKTISEGFNRFHQRLTPTGTQTAVAISHRKSIRQCLVTNYGLTGFFMSGSFGNGTSIYGYSDVDYFAVLPANQLSRDSGYSLKKIRGTLADRFPNTRVRVDDPAVLIPFGPNGSESTEVVPCCKHGQHKGHQVYLISNCSGGWLKTSPDAHNAYVRHHNSRLKSRLKPLIRFVKAWKFFNQVEISSFYIELRIVKLMEGKKYISYTHDLATVFKWLSKHQLPAIQDPVGISGYIQPCKTATKKQIALSKLKTAETRAQKALDAEQSGQTKAAFDWYNLLFNSKFPSYY